MTSKDHKKLASGHTYEEISGEEYERQARDFTAYKPGMIRLSPGGWYLPPSFVKYADKLFNFEFRSSDIVVMTWPKMGTTWTQEIVWTMKNNPDLNHPFTDFPTNLKCPFIDMDMIMDNESLQPVDESHPIFQPFQFLCPGKDVKDGLMLQMGEMIPDPRTLKTHLPLSFFKEDMLDKCKIVYVARNPKDGVMSYLHHSRLIKMHGYIGTTDQFVQYFLDDELMYSPYWEHIREAWLKRDHPNLHFIFYEDLKKDTEGEFRRLAKFLDISLTDQQIQNVLKHTSFEHMKEVDTTSGVFDAEQLAQLYNMEVKNRDGGFFRKGESGSWKGNLSGINETKIDLWTKKNTLGLGLNFKYSE